MTWQNKSGIFITLAKTRRKFSYIFAILQKYNPDELWNFTPKLRNLVFYYIQNWNSKLFEGHLNDLYDFANIFFCQIDFDEPDCIFLQ